jgi:tetratricopeptide (TPR) repeat protein
VNVGISQILIKPQAVGDVKDRRPRLRLDFDGFEPDQGSLARFAEHLLAKIAGPETETEEAYRAAETVERIFGCNFWSAALVSLGIQLDGALSAVTAGLEAAEREAGMEPPGGAPETLTGMLRAAVGETGLVMSAVDAGELSVLLRGWLVETFPPDGNVAVDLEGSSGENRPLALEIRADPLLGRLLRLIALCGDCAPVDRILDFLGVSPTERDNLLDALDRSVEVEGRGALLRDYEYRHPSFPGNLVYGFRDPALQVALAVDLPAVEREESARSFYYFLLEALEDHSRGAEKLLQRLSRNFPGGLEADLHGRVLSWWVNRDEVGALKAHIAGELRSGALPVETLWSVIERVSERWPVFRCFALLDVYAGELAEASPRQRGAYHLLRAVLRRREVRLAEAYEEARLASSFYDQDTAKPREPAQAHAVAARTATELRYPDVAKLHWERALEILERGHGETAEVSSVRRNLADLAASAGDFAAAVKHQEKALRIEERLFGGDDPRVAYTLRILGGFAAQAGDSAARSHLERALKIDTRSLGDLHERVGEDCRMLADLLWGSGDRVAARQLQERALGIEAELRGEVHPQVGSALKLLAQWSWEMGDAAAARGHLERALAIERSLSGERAVETGRLHQALEAICTQLGDAEGARSHGERVREIGVGSVPAP